MQIESVDRRNIAPPLAREIAELLCTVFQKPGWTIATRSQELIDGCKEYRGTEGQFPRSYIIRDGDRLIAHVEISPRTIGTNVGDMTIGALAGVCTAPDVRGRGLGAILVRKAFELVDYGTFPFSLFQNSDSNRLFYEKLGARVIDNRIVNSLGEDPLKNPFWAQLAMVYPAAKPWPPGEVDLRGPGY
jgi:predicted N-acetyltransferase YhbS